MLPLIILNLALAVMNLLLYQIEASYGRSGRLQLFAFWFSLAGAGIITYLSIV